jgi:hypothetical protein
MIDNVPFFPHQPLGRTKSLKNTCFEAGSRSSRSKFLTKTHLYLLFISTDIVDVLRRTPKPTAFFSLLMISFGPKVVGFCWSPLSYYKKFTVRGVFFSHRRRREKLCYDTNH